MRPFFQPHDVDFQFCAGANLDLRTSILHPSRVRRTSTTKPRCGQARNPRRALNLLAALGCPIPATAHPASRPRPARIRRRNQLPARPNSPWRRTRHPLRIPSSREAHRHRMASTFSTRTSTERHSHPSRHMALPSNHPPRRRCRHLRCKARERRQASNRTAHRPSPQCRLMGRLPLPTSPLVPPLIMWRRTDSHQHSSSIQHTTRRHIRGLITSTEPLECPRAERILLRRDRASRPHMATHRGIPTTPSPASVGWAATSEESCSTSLPAIWTTSAPMRAPAVCMFSRVLRCTATALRLVSPDTELDPRTELNPHTGLNPRTEHSQPMGSSQLRIRRRLRTAPNRFQLLSLLPLLSLALHSLESRSLTFHKPAFLRQVLPKLVPPRQASLSLASLHQWMLHRRTAASHRRLRPHQRSHSRSPNPPKPHLCRLLFLSPELRRKRPFYLPQPRTQRHHQLLRRRLRPWRPSLPWRPLPQP